MSRSDRLWVLSYDISSNKKRRRVARQLEDVMTRVQYSVFEGRPSDRQLDNVVHRINKELEEGDSLRVYSIGSVGERRSRVAGDGIPVDKNVGFWLL